MKKKGRIIITDHDKTDYKKKKKDISNGITKEVDDYIYYHALPIDNNDCIIDKHNGYVKITRKIREKKDDIGTIYEVDYEEKNERWYVNDKKSLNLLKKISYNWNDVKIKSKLNYL